MDHILSNKLARVNKPESHLHNQLVVVRDDISKEYSEQYVRVIPYGTDTSYVLQKSYLQEEK